MATGTVVPSSHPFERRNISLSTRSLLPPGSRSHHRGSGPAVGGDPLHELCTVRPEELGLKVGWPVFVMPQVAPLDRPHCVPSDFSALRTAWLADRLRQTLRASGRVRHQTLVDRRDRRLLTFGESAIRTERSAPAGACPRISSQRSRAARCSRRTVTRGGMCPHKAQA